MADNSRNNYLTDKQRRFINFYLELWNGTEAAKQAGYCGDRNTLASVASENLRKPKIREEIERRLTAEALGPREVLWRLGEQSRGDIAEFIDVLETGQAVVNLEKARQQGKLHLIKKLRYNARGGLEIELYDAQAALALLGKHHGLLKETIEHSGDVHVNLKWEDAKTDGNAS